MSAISVPFVSVICLFLVQSCSPEPVTEEALQAYVREPGNGLIKTSKRGRLEVSAVYRPSDLIVAQEQRGKATNEATVQKLKEKYGDYAYFVLSISDNGKDALYSTAGSYQQFSDNLQKLSFRMNDYLHMTTSAKDTVYLTDHHFSRMHGMGGSTQVLLAFDRNQIKNEGWVQLNLKEMGLGAGRVNLRFDVKDILNTPGIDFLN
ncbi:MAG: hypothetical protein MI975_21640 [Cytophagales bacterium]|nr:hypothetical protein [Cytophagales bacterium]